MNNNISVNTNNQTSSDFVSQKLFQLRKAPLKFRSETKELKDSFEKAKSKESKSFANKGAKLAMAALSPIPQVRKISSTPDDIKDGNWLRAMGLMGYMLMFLPEDTRDLINAGKQVAHKFNKNVKFEHRYSYNTHQHAFSTLKGTFAEPLLRFKGSLSENISNLLKELDINLFDTKIGDYADKIFKFKDFEIKKIGEYGDGQAIKLFGMNEKFLPKLVKGSLLRITKLSVLILGALELPNIIKSFKEPESVQEKGINGLKQIVKSGTYVTSVLGAIGTIGYIGASMLGPVGSLAGMGLGAILGGACAKFINKNIDKIAQNKNNS